MYCKNTGNDLNETAKNKRERETRRSEWQRRKKENENDVGDTGGKGGVGPNKILIKFYNLETTLSRALYAAGT